MFESLSEIIRDALDLNEQWQAEFTEEYGTAPLANSVVLHRQALVAALLRAHPDLAVREGRSVEGGRLEVVLPDDGGTFLLKPKGALECLPSVRSQGTLPGVLVECQSEEVIGYDLVDGAIVLYKAPYKRIKIDGQKRDELDGAWTLMFAPSEDGPFSQEEPDTDSDEWDERDEDTA